MKKEKSVIIMNFQEESVAYQGFSEMKRLHTEGKIRGYQMAVLKHDKGAKLNAKDFIDFTGADKNIKDSLIGMLIGILGGPLGVLLGWVVGSVVGSMQDAGEVKSAMTVFEKTLQTIPEDATGIILIANETDPEIVNDIVYGDLKGNIARMDEELVQSEIREAQAAEQAAGETAKKKWFKK